MAVLNVKASTLLESLVALILILLLFSSGAYLLHNYYFLGAKIDSIHLRNSSESLGYFYRFEPHNVWKKRVEKTVYRPASFTVNANTIVFVFRNGPQEKIFRHDVD